MNLSDFRTRVARAIGMSSSNAADLALIDAWVNESVVQFLKDTKLNVLKASLSVTAGSADYTLDSDILAFMDVWYEPASNVGDYPLEPMDSREILRMRIAQGSSAADPAFFGVQGAHLLMLHPAPQSSSDLVHMLYVPRPSAAISNTADSPGDATRGNIPSEYHPILEAYVKWKAAQAEEHKPSEFGLQFQAEYDKGISKTRVDLNKKAGVFLPRKLVGRRRSYPRTPGSDLR